MPRKTGGARYGYFLCLCCTPVITQQGWSALNTSCVTEPVRWPAPQRASWGGVPYSQQQCVWLQVEHARKFGLSGRSSSLQLSAVSHQCRRPPLAGLLRCSCQRFHTSVVVLGSTSRSTKEPRVSSMLHVEQCGCACAWVPRSAHACAVRSVLAHHRPDGLLCSPRVPMLEAAPSLFQTNDHCDFVTSELSRCSVSSFPSFAVAVPGARMGHLEDDASRRSDFP